MAEKDTLLAILELDCLPDLLISRAAWISNAFGLKTHLVLFEPDSGAMLGGLSISNETDRIRERIQFTKTEILEDYAQRLRDQGIEVSTEILPIRPLGDGILEIASRMDPRLVLKSTTHHSAAERSILVDTDWQLMRVCPYPLWLVKSESMPDHPKVVAAVDPSNAHDKPAALDHAILRSAKAIAAAAQGKVEVIHVYERLSGIGRAAALTFKPEILPIDEIDARIKREHRSALDALVTANHLELDVTHQLPGKVEEILPTFTRTHGASVLVMGGLARWGIKRMIIGSTTERVVDHLACDILIVRLGEHQLFDEDS